jgi:DivIVA domain-containing protein
MLDHYEVLGVTRDASTEDIKRACKLLSTLWHPDTNKRKDAAERFDEVRKAAGVLLDPAQRAAYDRETKKTARGKASHTGSPRSEEPTAEARVSSMVWRIENIKFSVTRLSPGYDEKEVDDFLDEIRDFFAGVKGAVPITPADVRNKSFTVTRFRPGYDEVEVDSFLDEVELAVGASLNLEDPSDE